MPSEIQRKNAIQVLPKNFLNLNNNKKIICMNEMNVGTTSHFDLQIY